MRAEIVSFVALRRASGEGSVGCERMRERDMRGRLTRRGFVGQRFYRRAVEFSVK